MQIRVYQEQQNSREFEHFLELMYGAEMNFLASDLLKQGLAARAIYEGVKRAITAGRNAGLTIRRHFQPIYTQAAQGIIRDCRLTKLGYALVLLNVRPDSTVVAEWQLRLVQNFLSE